MSFTDYLTHVATASNVPAQSSSEMLANMKQCMAELEKMKDGEDTIYEYLNPSFEISKEMLVDPMPFTAEYWEPAPWGQFATLEKSDEHWARPLGLGRLVTREQLMQRCQDWALNYSLKFLHTPSFILCHTV